MYSFREIALNFISINKCIINILEIKFLYNKEGIILFARVFAFHSVAKNILLIRRQVSGIIYIDSTLLKGFLNEVVEQRQRSKRHFV